MGVRRAQSGRNRRIPEVSMGNILFGIVMILGGLSGKLVLIGTQSSGALVAVGVGLLGYGVYQRNQGGGGN
jgi:hypothetical protein